MNHEMHHDFLIALDPGATSGNRGVIGVIKREDDAKSQPVQCHVYNNGTAPFTFTVANSNNNESGLAPDAYADINFRTLAGSVASATVAPKGELVVFIENAVKPYLLLKVTEAQAIAGALGLVRVSVEIGTLTYRIRKGVL
jgi:hypothetical protein